MSILLLDNYDSFTYNLYHYCQLYSDDIVVRRNDAISLEEINQFDKILLSPGPGLPDEAGIMPVLIEQYHSKKSILGVCLGLQAIAEFFGAELRNLEQVIHGKQSQLSVLDQKDRLFKDLPNSFRIGHYHSWVIDEHSLPKELIASSVNEQGLIMSAYHSQFDIRGVQFHPESVLTEYGKEMIRNWLEH